MVSPGRTVKYWKGTVDEGAGRPLKERMTLTWNGLKEPDIQKPMARSAGTWMKEWAAQPKTEALQKEHFLRAEWCLPAAILYPSWTRPPSLLLVTPPTSKKTVAHCQHRGLLTPLLWFSPPTLLRSNQHLLPSPHLFPLSDRCRASSREPQLLRPPHPHSRSERSLPSQFTPKQLLLSPLDRSQFRGQMIVAPVWHSLLLLVFVLYHPPGADILR